MILVSSGVSPSASVYLNESVISCNFCVYKVSESVTMLIMIYLNRVFVDMLSCCQCLILVKS